MAHVLVIHEQDDYREWARHVLKRAGLEVIEARDALAGMQRAIEDEPDLVVVAGTQNGSGYTGFQGECVDTWFKKRGGWDLCVRVPLMSFPGKDDALFIFRRKDAAA